MVQSPQIKLNLLGYFMLETKHKKSHSLQVTGTTTNLLKTKKCKLMYMNKQLLEINSRLMQVHSQNCTKKQNKLKWLIERRMVDKETEAESCELRYLNDDFKTRVSSFHLVPTTQNPSPHEDPAWCSCKVLLVTTGMCNPLQNFLSCPSHPVATVPEPKQRAAIHGRYGKE